MIKFWFFILFLLFNFTLLAKYKMEIGKQKDKGK